MESNSSVCQSDGCRQRMAEQLNHDLSSVLLPVTIFVGIEAVLGFLGNILVIYIYMFRYHVCNFKYFVLCLAVIDLVSCLTTVPGEMVTQLYWYVYPVPIICKIKSFFNVFTVAASAVVLLVMAIDRFLKICRPLGQQIRPKLALGLCVVIFVTAFAIAFPVAIYWGTRSYTKLYRGNNVTVTLCEKDQTYEHTGRPLAYSISIQTSISTLMISMAVLYAAIARTLFRRIHKSSRDSDNHNRSRSTWRAARSSTDTSSHDEASQSEKKQADQTREETTEQTATSNSEEPRGQKPARLKTLTMDSETSEVTTHHRTLGSRVRRKTLIMFLLTAVFIVTTILYLSLLSGIAKSEDILDSMTDVQKAVYFFFFRLYFINHVINPILYGLLDPKCRGVIKSFWKK